ncbi:hypothetical protein HO133_007943 [Letharia lupina]|uniref:Uncharacterized protein n=1 Tax=Letharia lupina TaxID=560253 RepID=A0A8H6FHM3_9LECA|nr:uncharacterized protein HO133_007943 [Letharia lupina]KAF6228213.1 hypothetical protein HO133_007943 [Letharia lupina]
MASTDSTVPDTSTGDSAGGHAGQSFTDKAKSALKGNVPTADKGTEQSAEKDVKERMDQGVGKDTGSSSTQNTLL